MDKISKHRDSFLRVSVFFLILTIIANINISIATANETTNTLKLSLSDTEYETSRNTITLPSDVDKKYTFEIKLENIGAGDSSIVVTPFASTAISRESSILYTSNTENLLDDKYDFSNYVTIASEAIDEENQIEIAPNESVGVSITINVPHDIELEGTVMGGINFKQILGVQTAEDSISIASAYESIIFINLIFSKYEDIQDIIYQDFSFVALQDTVNLQFYALNYNPILGNLNNALYELINPNGEIIASGELADSVLLTPLTKSRMQIPLIDDSELIEGEYRLTIETTRKAITTTFSYEKEDLDNFKKENRPTNTANVHTNNQILIWIIFVLIAALAAAVIYILKSKRKREG